MQTKNTFRCVALLGMAVGLFGATPLSAQIAGTYSAPDITVAPGAEFFVTPTLDSFEALSGFSYSFCFDPQVMTLQGISPSSEILGFNSGMGPDSLQTQFGLDHYGVAVTAYLPGTETIPPSTDFALYRSRHEAVGSAGDSSPLNFCTDAFNLFLVTPTPAFFGANLEQGSVTLEEAAGFFGFAFGPAPTMGDDFDVGVTLSFQESLEGFRFGLGHDALQVAPVAVNPSLVLLALNGGAGPDTFLVDLNAGGGTGVTIDVGFSDVGAFSLPPAAETVVEVTYTALLSVGDCQPARFEVRGDLGVPIELDVASGTTSVAGAEGYLNIAMSPPAPPSGGVTLRVGSGIAPTGATGVVPVTLDTDVEVQGISFSAQHADPDYTLIAIEPGLDLQTLDCHNGIDFFGVSIPGAGTDFGSVVAIVDLELPSADQVFPPGSGFEIALLRYQVGPSPVNDQITIELVDELGTPPLQLEVTSNLMAITPATESGTLTTLPGFIRGDCNSDGLINIADPINLLGILFPSGSAIPIICLDACDTNDDGFFDIGDAIFLLDTLFGTSVLSAPSSCGFDPTPDALDCNASGGAC